MSKKTIYIVFGVSGCGKTTVGRALSETISLPFYDADDFHPQENIDKMSSGVALQDADRMPWLQTLNSNLQEWAKEEGAVLACSALKESYRDILKDSIENIRWIYLSGEIDLIAERMKAREHFMPRELLQSQFDTLEVPAYGLHLDIRQSPEELVSEIVNEHRSFGLIGLGVMGKALGLNLLDQGVELSVYNRSDPNEADLLRAFMRDAPSSATLSGFNHLGAFVQSLAKPRKIFLMISAGKAVDAVVEDLKPFLDAQDIILDGGNSFFRDSERRADSLAKHGIHFIGCGVSGGESGARNGPSIMPGGNEDAYRAVEPILNAIAAKEDEGNACCTYLGPAGTGHFVKMVHNGIEYAEMQLLAEVFELLSIGRTRLEVQTVLQNWSTGEAQSYLLEITAKILEKKDGEDYLLDLILDKAGNKGTGAWSSIEAYRLGTANTMMSAAVFARYTSSLKEIRSRYSGQVANKTSSEESIDESHLLSAYQAARRLNHAQGFVLLEAATEEFYWKLPLADIARIWSKGCIIQSKLLAECRTHLNDEKALLDSSAFFERVKSGEAALGACLTYAIQQRLSLPCFSAAHQYWVAMTTENSSANLIQAQRDFFGAHTYQRRDKNDEAFYHSNWT